MINEQDQQLIARFQENLGVIRKVAGWTAERMASEIGVTRQTIGSLEKRKSAMGRLQYLALRTVLNAEIIRRPNRDLAKVIVMLVDKAAEMPGLAPLSHDSASPDGGVPSPCSPALAMLSAETIRLALDES